jgi:hypothetical protein
MPHLFGREWTKRELLERVGDLAQVAGVERFTYDEGVSGGVKAARVRTGAGLEFTVLLSRGMDISHCTYKGLPLAWVSSTGAGHPHAFDAHGDGGRGWLRTFHGGLLTGCGLSNAGASNQDGDEALGIHGWLSHSPADETGAWTAWSGDEATVIVDGTMREARVFGENLRLTRRITAKVGSNALKVHDTVENVGFKTVPLMLLYHLNFGWPLVSEHAEIVYAARSAPEPRDAVAEPGVPGALRLDAPIPGYAEQCFFHDVKPAADGTATVLMVNRALNLGVRVAYDQNAFPHLTEWKMMGQGEYVCGIEPANCRVFGRAAERAAGRLQEIGPGETRTFTASISVLDGVDAITAAEGEVRGLG